MVAVLIFVALVVIVGLLAWRPPQRVQVRSCCSARPWPPTDLMDDPAEPTPAPPPR